MRAALHGHPLMLEHQAQEQDGSSHSLDAELDSGPMDISHRSGSHHAWEVCGGPTSPLHFLGPWCAEQGRPGVDMGRLWSPEDRSLSSFSVPRTLTRHLHSSHPGAPAD